MARYRSPGPVPPAPRPTSGLTPGTRVMVTIRREERPGTIVEARLSTEWVYKVQLDETYGMAVKSVQATDRHVRVLRPVPKFTSVEDAEAWMRDTR